MCWQPARLQRLAGEPERAAACCPEPAHVVGMQVGDRHGIQAGQVYAQFLRVARQRGRLSASGQAGVEQHTGTARAHKIGNARLSGQAAAVAGEPFDERQDRDLVDLAEVPQASLDLSPLRRPWPVAGSMA